MIAIRRSFIQSVAALGLVIGCLTVISMGQTRDQVSDPNNPVPEYVRRAAESRGPAPSFSEIRERAIAGQVWPGERRPPTLSKSDQKRIAAMLKPDPADVEAYKNFLDKDDTGIFRLYSDYDCESKSEVSVAGSCANQVHGGSTRSLRPGSNYPDLKFNHGKLTGIGFFSQEILVDLGDVPIDSLTLVSPGMDFLNSFAPGNSFASANKQFGEIVAGMKVGEHFYSRSVVPLLNHTYGIRLVAFDNNDSIQLPRYRSSGRDMTAFRFYALQRDKRSDVILAFRVIRVESDGNITVVWKQLSRKKSPTISFDKNETPRSFK